MSVQAGARCLEREVGGRGVLLGGVPGVDPAKVAVNFIWNAQRNAVAVSFSCKDDFFPFSNYSVVQLAQLHWFFSLVKALVDTKMPDDLHMIS